MDESTSNLVTELRRPSITRITRIVPRIIVVLLVLFIVLSIAFVALYIHEKNTGDAKMGNVCYDTSCIITAAGTTVFYAFTIMLVLHVKTLLL